MNPASLSTIPARSQSNFGAPTLSSGSAQPVQRRVATGNIEAIRSGSSGSGQSPLPRPPGEFVVLPVGIGLPPGFQPPSTPTNFVVSVAGAVSRGIQQLLENLPAGHMSSSRGQGRPAEVERMQFTAASSAAVFLDALGKKGEVATAPFERPHAQGILRGPQSVEFNVELDTSSKMSFRSTVVDRAATLLNELRSDLREGLSLSGSSGANAAAQSAAFAPGLPAAMFLQYVTPQVAREIFSRREPGPQAAIEPADEGVTEQRKSDSLSKVSADPILVLGDGLKSVWKNLLRLLRLLPYNPV